VKETTLHDFVIHSAEKENDSSASLLVCALTTFANNANQGRYNVSKMVRVKNETLKASKENEALGYPPSTDDHGT